jgi:hypothetical protein
MPFEISGYVLESVRVGQANSPFTQTPDDYISDQIAFNAAYPSSETNPRTDYLALVLNEGTSIAGLLANAKFAWTKNELVNRFDYAARQGRFKPLPGSELVSAGTLGSLSNTNRIKVTPPVQIPTIPDAPYRLSVGSGSGTTFAVNVVANDGSFGAPPSLTAELSFSTGNLNWNATDLVTYSGQSVRFQQQQFYTFDKSTGKVGFAPITLSDPPILLNPKPGTGQFPLLRFGFSLYLQTVEVANDGLFTVPPLGTVQWSLATGRLNFNPTDATNHAGIPVYYDGVVFARDLLLPRQVLGNIAAPAAIIGLPPVGLDLIFAIPSATPYYQFPKFSYVTVFNPPGSTGVVQVIESTGAVQFSAADQATFSGKAVTVIFGDLPIERGISIRLFRTPVNLDASRVETVATVPPSVWADPKDVTDIYQVIGAVWANPIIGSPQVFLPSIPIDDLVYPFTVEVVQGQGTFTSPNFPRLDVASPPSGLGYYIDFDALTFFYAQRKNLILVPTPQPTVTLVLPDPLVLSGNLLLEMETGTGTGFYVPLVLGKDALFDSTAGVVTFITSHGEILAKGSNASVAGLVLTDLTASFITAGILPGCLVEIAGAIFTVAFGITATSMTLDLAPPASPSGVQYTIRKDREILADRFFSEVALLDPTTKVERIRLLGAATNLPRLSVPVVYVGKSRFRFGPASANVFPTVVLVANDGAFTPPPAGTVQLSQDTGNLNFAVGDFGTDVYWVRELISKVDFQISAGLGLIQFSDRLLSLEEVLVTYTTAPPSTDPPTPPGPPIQEYATFLIRKEITQPHPIPTSVLLFNTASLGAPHPLPVASNPPPSVFRGGRPQQLDVQCIVDTVNSTITFLPDNQVTNALPHGAAVNPSERVYIDYFVTQAVGGEKTTTVLNPPLLTAVVNITEDTNQFVVHGDQTANFPTGNLFRIEKQEVYLIGSSTYSAGPNQTTVTLFGAQIFQTTFNDPKVYVSSGPTPITSVPLIPSYFVPELQAFEAIARGSNKFLVTGDRTLSYKSETVVLFTDGLSTFTDFIQVSGSKFDADTNRTEVTLTANAIRQYVGPTQLLLYSVRPIFEPPTVEVQTSQIPVVTQPFEVYRRVSGTPGVVLVAPTDYTIDQSGKIIFTSALTQNEEFSIFYTGMRTTSAGPRLRASYTSQIAPNSTNGLAGQALLANYFISSPDTFYYRVETMTNFRGEFAQEISAEASSGSSGPQTSNASQPKLFEQGRKSLYFDERHLANQDIVARSSLLFYNNSINFLEDYIQFLNGRVVGNNDGKFVFDGTTGAVHPPGPVTNQIDDVIQVSPAPYTITFPPFSVTSIGTFRKYYIPGALSRFYPTSKNFFGVSAVTPTSKTGDEVLDTRSTKVTLVANLHTRLAWGILTESTATSGSTIFKVDFADGTEPGFNTQAETYARPPFKTGMKCVVQRRDGSFINDEVSPITVSVVAPNQLTISGLASVADKGTTVYRSPIDDSVQVDPDTLTYYLLGRDYGFHGDSGQLTYVKPLTPLVVPDLVVHPIVQQQALSGVLTLTNTLTAPLKFPALFGGVEDDDGDLSFPIQSPVPTSEDNGFLLTEDSIIHTGTGLLRTLTTPPFLSSTGSLDVTKTIITNGGGPFPAPIPKIHDLVRILTGLNGPSAFVRVTVVGASTITVDTPFAFVDAGFTYEIAVSSLTVTGSATAPFSPTILTDAAATFISGGIVKVGYTVVGTSGANTGERRQITSLDFDTQLTLATALPFPFGLGDTYRIDNPLATYGGTPNDYLTTLEAALLGEIALYPTEQAAIANFFNEVFTDIFVSATGQTVSTNVLNDVFGTYLTSGVLPSHYVFIQAGGDAGIYQVQTVNSESQLLVESATPFPATLVGVSYRIVSAFGVSKKSLTDLFAIYLVTNTLLQNATTFYTLVSTQVPVVRLSLPDITTFARATLISDLDARDALVDARIAAIPTTVDTVDNILVNTDSLYNTRYVWIDARINLENGLVVQQATAVTNRIKAQAGIFNQLVKLLAVQH